MITNPPYDKGAPVSYWIQEKRKIFFNLFTITTYTGNYTFDSGGCEVQMPFFNLETAKERLKELNENNI